jgi:hypothetical protein
MRSRPTTAGSSGGLAAVLAADLDPPLAMLLTAVLAAAFDPDGEVVAALAGPSA